MIKNEHFDQNKGKIHVSMMFNKVIHGIKNCLKYFAKTKLFLFMGVLILSVTV